MTRRAPHRRRLLWLWLAFIVCVPLLFWALMAWQEPLDQHEPYWFAGTWQAPEGRPGNQITFERPDGVPEPSSPQMPATINGSTGKVIFSNFFEDGTVRLDWRADDSDDPLVLHFTGGSAGTGIPAYAALRFIDDHNMQIRFANDAQTVRRPGFLSGDSAHILTRWP